MALSASGNLGLRTYGTRGRDFKHGLLEPGRLDPGTAEGFRQAQLPALIEVYDRQAALGQDVYAEILIDPTEAR